MATVAQQCECAKCHLTLKKGENSKFYVVHMSICSHNFCKAEKKNFFNLKQGKKLAVMS